ncbi:MAG: hypothetical protein ACJ71K_02500 [Nitrososphaeraceae archaeon]
MKCLAPSSRKDAAIITTARSEKQQKRYEYEWDDYVGNMTRDIRYIILDIH